MQFRLGEGKHSSLSRLSGLRLADRIELSNQQSLLLFSEGFLSQAEEWAWAMSTSVLQLWCGCTFMQTILGESACWKRLLAVWLWIEKILKTARQAS